MALINIGSIVKVTLKHLLSLPLSHTIGLFSYKRNRKVVITRLTEEIFEIKEEGYFIETQHVSAKKLEKNIRTLVKREFPRSRKVRLYKLGAQKEEQLSYKKI